MTEGTNPNTSKIMDVHRDRSIYANGDARPDHGRRGALHLGGDGPDAGGFGGGPGHAGEGPSPGYADPESSIWSTPDELWHQGGYVDRDYEMGAGPHSNRDSGDGLRNQMGLAAKPAPAALKLALALTAFAAFFKSYWVLILGGAANIIIALS